MIFDKYGKVTNIMSIKAFNHVKSLCINVLTANKGVNKSTRKKLFCSFIF